MKNNLFIAGFMGAGKSIFASILAKSLGWAWVDLDEEIEKTTGKSINSIFQESGETHFRHLETDFLKKLNLDNTIVSLGGGTPCYNDNLNVIKQKGKMIYLYAETDFIFQRLMNETEKRPLVKQFENNKEELRIYVDQKLSEREMYYFQADLIIQARNWKLDEVNELVKEWGRTSFLLR